MIIKLSDILRPAMSFEQQIYCEAFYSALGNRVTNVEPLFYEGPIAGTEFLVYAATKIYICFEISLFISFSTATTAYISKRLLGDAVLGAHVDTFVYYDGAAVVYFGNRITERNVTFVRFTYRNYDYMKFDGYRVTII